METATSWMASQEIVARLSGLRPGINYDESNVPEYVLPDVLADGKGGRVTDVESWRRRRAEILEMLATEEYGFSPERPQDQWFELKALDKGALNGAATLKLVDIHLGKDEKAPVIHLQMFIPNQRTAPAPAFLLICNRGKENIDVTRVQKSEFWPVEELVARGYAATCYHYEDVAPDHFDGFTTGVYPYFQGTAPRDGASWGAVAAWAWGGSRCMDYFETDADIDAAHCAVCGHSRGGKTALWCGANDERWALTVSSCSGCSGAALAKRCYGETVKFITNSFKHWFCGNYCQYREHEADMPFDQHFLIAAIAPRAVYVHSADEDLWADPRGEWLSLLNAAPVWRLLGRKGLPTDVMPPLETPVIGDGMGYHIRKGSHNYLLSDWMRHADFFDRELER